jgi:hypothetical protein
MGIGFFGGSEYQLGSASATVKGDKMNPVEDASTDRAALTTSSTNDRTQPRAKYELPVLETHGVWMGMVGVGITCPGGGC